jgi:GH35 family endo-1,4-beta-xylanase
MATSDDRFRVFHARGGLRGTFRRFSQAKDYATKQCDAAFLLIEDAMARIGEVAFWGWSESHSDFQPICRRTGQ